MANIEAITPRTIHTRYCLRSQSYLNTLLLEFSDQTTYLKLGPLVLSIEITQNTL